MIYNIYPEKNAVKKKEKRLKIKDLLLLPAVTEVLLIAN